MTKDEFKKQVLEMFHEIEGSENMELYLHFLTFNDNIVEDIEIAATGCLVCHRDTLVHYIIQENIQHLELPQVH